MGPKIRLARGPLYTNRNLVATTRLESKSERRKSSHTSREQTFYALKLVDQFGIMGFAISQYVIRIRWHLSLAWGQSAVPFPFVRL